MSARRAKFFPRSSRLKMLQKGDPRDIGHALQFCHADKRQSRHKHMIAPIQRADFKTF